MAVNFKETMRYGAKILGYVVLVALISGIFAVPGMFLLPQTTTGMVSNVSSARSAFGGILSFVGFLIFVSGMFGIQYKIISDGVETGSGNETETFEESDEESRDLEEESESTVEEAEETKEESE